jgi:sigma-54 dependent transcriptional regulator, acetoin dehydrogenase operon transcriptional activator AcoR
VFKPSLCGAECSFCDGCEKTLGHKRYPTIFLDRQGLRKEFDVRTIPLIDESGNHIGVVTSLIDRTEMKSLQRRLASEQEFWGIVGQDHKMQLIYDLVRDLGQSDFPVVISGESGTGKELVAHAIHSESSRRDRPFIAINCGALPEGTLESELFGHVRGAFTGAIRDKKGRFELADGGTLLLDEVSELTPAIQVKLLRVLQEGIVEPVGSEKSRPVNVRIISASNKNLKDLVKSDAFR